MNEILQFKIQIQKNNLHDSRLNQKPRPLAILW